MYAGPYNCGVVTRLKWIYAPTKTQAETLAHLQKSDGEKIVAIYTPLEFESPPLPFCPFKKGDYIKDKNNRGQYIYVEEVTKDKLKYTQVANWKKEGLGSCYFHLMWFDAAQYELSTKQEFDYQLRKAKDKYKHDYPKA